MKCPRCKKDFEKGVKAAYELGLWDGEKRIRRNKKQLRAYYLVKVEGNTLTEAGRLMGGISHQAVTGLLRRLKKNRNPPK